MTLKDAKDCVKNKYPQATAFYSRRHNGVFIHVARYFLSPIIGPAVAAESSTKAWKEVAQDLFEGVCPNNGL